MDKLTTCCFTGHRPGVLFETANEAEVLNKIFKAVESAVADGYTDFLCGGCVGGDFLFADAVIMAKSKYADKGLRLCMCLPCRDQSAKWDRHTRDRYSGYLDVADSVVCLNEKYVNGCMQQRNRYMVDRSSLLIAAYNGTPGGTAYTFRYASKCGLRIVNVLDKQREESNQLSFL